MVFGTTVMGALIAAFVYTIGTGDMRLTLMVAFVAIAPALLILALKRSYLFPYGLYVVLVPFDNMLRITGAGTLTKFLGIASTLFIIVYAARRKGLNPPPLTLYLWCGYMLWLMLTVMWTPDTTQGVVDIQQMLSLTAMYAVLAVAPVEERDVRAICACIIIGGIAASVYGIYLLHDSAMSMLGDAGRIMINVDNRSIDPNHFANALLAPIALSLTSLLHARKPATILGSLFALTVLMAGVLMSVSREALLGCILIVVVTVAFSKRRVLGLAIGVPLLLMTPVLFPQIGVRMSDAFATGGAGRMSIWQVGWMAFQQHPFIGWGAGGFAAAYDRYYLTVFQFYNAGWSRASHNTLIHAAVELGVIGVVLMMVAFASSFRQFRGITRGTPLYDLRVAFTASLVALGFVAVFIDLANYKYVWIVLTTIAQLRTVARMQRAVRAPTAVYEPPPPQRHRARRRAVPAAP
jgi:O-antigen ligase